MTKYSIVWSESAARELAKLDRSVAKRILDRVEILTEDPRRHLLRLVGSPCLRLRLGDYRFIVELEEGRPLALVLKAGHRRAIY